MAHGDNALKIPKIEGLLAQMRGKLTRQILLHGLGTLALVLSIWLCFAFFADWILHVPAPIRWLHFFVLIALPIVFFWRELWRYLQKRPDLDGMAVLVERSHPDLHEVLVSAVQLRNTSPDAPEYALVESVVREAEDRVQQVNADSVFDGRSPRKRFALGAVAALIGLVIFGSNSAEASIFFARLVGRDVAWPQRTYLAVEIPLSDDRAQVEVSEEEIRVRVARGTDVPVIVRAEGDVPESVTMHFAGGHVSQIPATGGAIFRTLLRSCQEDIEFHVTGGDDQTGLPVVKLTVLQPPDVSGVAVKVTPPTYSGLEPYIEFDRDVEVLEGSALVVHMIPDPEDATGIARLFPEDREVELRSEPFPLRTPNVEGEPAEVERTGRAFDLIPDKTIRYRFELRDSSGLPNPDPGLFAVHVVEDRVPEVEILAPGRADVETVIGGALPLRVRVADDYGIASLRWTAEPADSGENELVQGDLAWSPIDARSNTEGSTRFSARGLASRLMNLSELSSVDTVTEGQQFTLEITSTDNCAPKANVGTSVPLRVRVVSTDEFLRRLQDRLARARLRANELVVLQREKHARTLELVAALESDEVDGGQDVGGIASALTGQRRVNGDASALARELASITEALLYSRIDDRADELLSNLDQAMSQYADKSFHAEAWQALVERNAASPISASLAGKLVDIVGIGLEVSEGHSNAAIEALNRAGEALDLEQVHDSLTLAAEEQDTVVKKVETLLERLAEWDNFQSVLALTKDILNRQKNLLERTRRYAKEQ